jgi:hypothetical protein
MPHSLIRIEEGKLAAIASSLVTDAKIFVTNYARERIEGYINEFLEQCPPPQVLEQINRTINTIERLEQSYEKTVDKVNQLPKKLDKPILLAKVAIDILTHVLEAKFTTIGVIPPTGGPVPGVLFSERLGKILTQAGRLEDAKKIVFTLEDEKESIGVIAMGAQGALDPVKSRLQLLKDLLERCALDPNLSKEERDKILNNKAKPGDRSDIEEYRSSNGKVYELDVVQVLDNTINVPRRQAIAKDFREIVVLRGPASYSSSAQILKDELKFRIDNQLP